MGEMVSLKGTNEVSYRLWMQCKYSIRQGVTPTWIGDIISGGIPGEEPHRDDRIALTQLVYQNSEMNQRAESTH